MNRIYHILAQPIPPERVAALLTSTDSPWVGQPLQSRMREVSSALHSIQFSVPGSSMHVSLIRDDVAQTHYLAIEGTDLAEVRATGQAAERGLPIVSFGELLSAASAGYRERPHLLIQLALGTTPVVDAHALSLLVQAASDSRAAVRKAAINGLGLTQWVRAFDPLEDREANDPDPELRVFARRTIYSLRLALGMEQ